MVRRWQYPAKAEPILPPVGLDWVSETIIIWPQQVVQYPRYDFRSDLPQPFIPVFSLEECQALWETVSKMTWPSEEEPSGFVPTPPDVPPPSGFIRDSDGSHLWDL